MSAVRVAAVVGLSFVLAVLVVQFGLDMYSSHVPKLRERRDQQKWNRAMKNVLCDQAGTCNSIMITGDDRASIRRDMDCTVLYGADHHADRLNKLVSLQRRHVYKDSLLTYDDMASNPPYGGGRLHRKPFRAVGSGRAVVACLDRQTQLSYPPEINYAALKRADREKSILNPFTNERGGVGVLHGVLQF